MDKKDILIGVASLGAGLTIGFITGQIVSKKKYEKLLESEIDSVKQTYAPFNKEGIFATPGGAFEALHGGEEVVLEERPLTREEVSALLQEHGYDPLNSDDTYDVDAIRNETGYTILGDLDNEESAEEFQIDGDTIVNSIWENAAQAESYPDVTENEDGDAMPPRNPDTPYVITVDQFMTETQYDDNKVSLMYFEEDDTLCDERDSIVPNVEELVGVANLHRFGLGSRDRNTVYVRNEKKQMDFEIIRDSRSYQEVVLHVKPKAEKNAPRRMRDDD